MKLGQWSYVFCEWFYRKKKKAIYKIPNATTPNKALKINEVWDGHEVNICNVV